MRILAIRGANLASLAGDFEVDLAGGALGGAGLFAITGPTGAGKSTLLDALCLALYDRTPRLDARGGALIGHGDEDEALRLGANDVRTLLRQGAASGAAEVDFLGRDGRRWRARWSVRRARNRADGRLQHQEMALVELPSGRALGGTKKETLAAIEAQVGLSFDQFRRSALLAQGDFAAFLRAGAGERADLLERMTGTAIYGELSMAAHRRAALLDAELAALRLEVEGSPALDPDARRELEARRAAAIEALATARAALAAAEAAERWHGRGAELAAAVADADGAVAEVAQASAAAEPRRLRLRQVLAAAPLRPLLDERERRLRDAVRAEHERQIWAGRGEAAAEALDLALSDVADKMTALVRAERTRAEAQPELARAVALDAELMAAARVSALADSAAAEAAARAAAAAGEGAALSTELAVAADEHTAATAWLDGHAEVAPLHAQWERWRAVLARFAAAARGRDERVAARPVLAAAAETARAQAAEREAQRREAHQAHELAKLALEEAADRAKARPWDRARKLFDAAQAQRRALGELAAAVADAAQASGEHGEAAATARAAQAAAASARAEAAAAAGDGERAEVGLGEAERALDGLRAAIGMAQHRAELVDGEPCPLCGGREHPWAEGGVIDGVIGAQRERVAELRAARDAAIARRGEREGAAAIAEQSGGAAAVRALDAGRRLEAARERWRVGLAALGELPLFDDPAAAGAAALIQRRCVALDAELVRRRDELAHATAVREAYPLAQQLADARRHDLDLAVGAAHEAARAAATATVALAGLDEAQARAAAELAAAETELAAPLAGWADWSARLAGGSAAFAAELADAAAAYADHVGRAERSARVVEDGRARLGAVEATAAALRTESLQRADERAAACNAVAALRVARAAVLAGRAVAEAGAALDGAVAEARQAVDSARTGHAARSDEHSAAVARLEAARKEAGAAAVATAAAAESLLAAMTAVAIDDDAGLRALLAYGDDWIGDEREALIALDATTVRAAGVLAERRAQQAAHHAGPVPALAAPDARAAAAAGVLAVEAATEAWATLVGAIRVDDEARARRSASAERLLELEGRAGTFRALSDLIGSADGKKFRAFAQSLTLEALLGHANTHLDDLAPRYRLVRVPGHDLELQVVDRDMADEVRSVNSLSGGESFLLSLSLALALSSLSSRDVRVDTLLVDEGFGTLDPATLELALAALDALQSTGRQVGVISHIPGLAERIGARVVIERHGGGRSTVSVRAA